MIFGSFDSAVEYYRQEMIRRGLPVTLRVKHIVALTGDSDSVIYDAFNANKLARAGAKARCLVEDLIRWMIDSNRITIRA